MLFSCLYLLIGVKVLMPRLQNYKAVSYHWTTHKPRGLSANDTYMARVCDEKAKQLGALDASEKSQDIAQKKG